MIKKIFGCLVAILFLFQIAYAENKVINWYHANFPPGFIEIGSMKNDGYENYLERLIRDNLSDYSHSYRTANYSRILEQIRTTNACCVALLRNSEREKYIEYSLPTMIALSNGIFIESERIDEFKPFIDEYGYISIKDLFHNSEFNMGVSKGRIYGGAIDEILNKYHDSMKIHIRSGDDVLRGLVEMMKEGRKIDYVIGYPHEINWLNYIRMLEGDLSFMSIKFIPIKEMPKYVISQIGCSKNEWGKKVIRRINKLLGGKYIQEYKERYQRFLPPEAIKIHERYIDEVFPISNTH
ncbi:TIGR02285 family protein [uncultured Pseudodesulfovibrio sp.]|uniref:TIGR02285 family protein n=1 Tax=uncultured Pseudodesulfovibrio sp. TaxID=2035858 RepID=UPI0029C8FB5F|nr:TIGR02285 family protein [uncultured Pseudodesulfovibrio sp.]